MLDSGIKKYIPAIKSNTWRRKSSWSHPIGKNLQLLISKKHGLWTSDQETREMKLFTEYKTCRNLVKKETRILKQKAQSNIAKSCKNNPKKFWQYIKSKSSSSVGIGDFKVQVGSSVTRGRYYVTYVRVLTRMVSC